MAAMQQRRRSPERSAPSWVRGVATPWQSWDARSEPLHEFHDRQLNLSASLGGRSGRARKPPIAVGFPADERWHRLPDPEEVLAFDAAADEDDALPAGAAGAAGARGELRRGSGRVGSRH